MGGTSTTSQTQSSSLAPYSAASTGLNGIIGSLTNMVPSAGSLNSTQTGAINQMVGNSTSQPNYAPQISSGTLGLLNGGGATNNDSAISSNLGTLNSQLGATASGANIGANSALTPELNQIGTNATNAANSSWAAAGRSGSPGQAYATGQGVAAAEAPVIASQYNTDVANQTAAATDLYNAGNSTYGMLNNDQATANQNFTNGVGTVSSGITAENAAPTATLNAESQYFGIPASQLTTLLGAISPVAAQFGTQNGTASGTSTMSGAQQFATIASGIGSLWPKGSISFGS